jgi:hypothetical protein
MKEIELSPPDEFSTACDYPPALSILDSDEFDSFKDGFHCPKSYGYSCGCKWYETASLEAILKASVRLTTNQQLKVYLDLYNKHAEDGWICPEDGLPMITYPTFEPCDVDFEIYEYFKKIRNEHFYFTDTNGHNDLAACADYNGFYRDEIPNYLFRQFEDGWSDGVRNLYMLYLLKQSETEDDKTEKLLFTTED